MRTSMVSVVPSICDGNEAARQVLRVVEHVVRSNAGASGRRRDRVRASTSSTPAAGHVGVGREVSRIDSGSAVGSVDGEVDYRR